MSDSETRRAVVVRTLLYALPLSILAALVYRHALATWFHMDDFAWLGLSLDVRQFGLWNSLFTPRAQGTVRVFSERAFFLGLTEAFGLDVLPFKAVVFVTQCLNLTLLAVITRRLTGDSLAGWFAAAAWLFNSALAVPMAWLSAYNEILWSLVLLASFRFLLLYLDTGRTRYNVLQWAVYLFGFGVLELNVIYPALALLYTLCCARGYVRRVLPLFIPAVVFAGIHFFLIPKATDPLYQLFFDTGMVSRLFQYGAWALGPWRLGELIGGPLGPIGYVLTAGIALGLAAFAIRRGGWLAVFLAGWFVIVMAPVLPLKNHVSDYYLTAALIGPCILAGWSIATAPRIWQAAGLLLFAGYCAGHYAQFETAVRWRQAKSRNMQHFIEQVEKAGAGKSHRLLLLGGVDSDLFAMGFDDQPLRLYGYPRVRLMPGTGQRLAENGQLRGLERYAISREEADRAALAGDALVLLLQDNTVSDITKDFQLVAQRAGSGERPLSVDVSLPSSASALGPGWFPIENGFRWMGARAVVHFGPPKSGMKLVLTGYCPAAVVAAGPVHLTAKAHGRTLGSAEFSKPDVQFSVEFPILTSGEPLDVELSSDRPLHLPDGRTVSLIFGTLTVK